MTTVDVVPRGGLERPAPAQSPDPAQPSESGAAPLSQLPASCPLCGDVEALPLGVSEDFSYRVSPDTWLPLRCSNCNSVFISPTPTPAMSSRIYPPEYYAEADGTKLALSPARVGWRAVRRAIGVLDGHLRILDIGCGGGYYLRKLKLEGRDGISLEGLDHSPDAVAAARAAGLSVQQGRIEDLTIPTAHYDLALLIHTAEHLTDPVAALGAVRAQLRPGGRALLVLHNLASPCWRLFQGRHWGGYDLPRQRVLYSHAALRLLADGTGFELENVVTSPNPAGWVESVHRMLSDWHAPRWLSGPFAPGARVTHSLFALAERVLAASGRGGLLIVTMRRPPSGKLGT